MKRLFTAAALITAAVYLVFWAPDLVFLGAAILVSGLCYWEYSGLVAAHNITPLSILGFLAGLVILIRPEQALLAIALLICFFLSLLLLRNQLRGALPQAACALLGAFYTAAPWRFAVDLRRSSVHLLFFALALNWVGDTAAYYVGRRFGRHQLAPVVSPKKSWEGSAASVAGSVVFGILYLGKFATSLPGWQVALVAVIGNIAGQLGDLTESAIKRGAGVKDSGTMLPGHGGILDRLDSSLFGLPVVYGLLLIMGGLRPLS